jgi:hypothetical protein
MDADGLLLELALAPDDERVRSVYVDWLLENDPERGRHALLVRTGEAEAAERLLERFGEAWLSPAIRQHATPGSARFRDGLLDSIRLEPTTGKDAERLALEPAWRFVDRVEYAPLSVIREAPGLTSALLLPATAEELVGWKVVLPRLERLGLEVESMGRVAPLLDLHTFPRLTALDVVSARADGRNPRDFRPVHDDFDYGDDTGTGLKPTCSRVFEPEGWRAFFDDPRGRRVTTIEVFAGFLDLATWSRFLETTRCDVTRFIVSLAPGDGARWRIALERTGPGQYRRVEVLDPGASASDRADVDDVLATARALS